MTLSKKTLVITSLGILILLVIAILFLFQKKNPNTSQTNGNTPIPNAVSQQPNNGMPNGWSPYTNRYFFLAYPPTWNVEAHKFTGGQGISLSAPVQGSTLPAVISVDAYDGADQKTLEQKEQLYIGLGLSKKESEFNGLKADILQGQIDSGNIPLNIFEIQYYIIKNNVLFIVDYYYPADQTNNQEVINQILQTIQFN